MNEAYERRERGLETSSSISQNLDSSNASLPSTSTFYLPSADHSHRKPSSPSNKHYSTRIIGNPTDCLLEPFHSSSSKSSPPTARSLNPSSNEDSSQPSNDFRSFAYLANHITSYQTTGESNDAPYGGNIETEVINELDATAELAQQENEMDDSVSLCVIWGNQ